MPMLLVNIKAPSASLQYGLLSELTEQMAQVPSKPAQRTVGHTVADQLMASGCSRERVRSAVGAAPARSAAHTAAPAARCCVACRPSTATELSPSISIATLSQVLGVGLGNSKGKGVASLANISLKAIPTEKSMQGVKLPRAALVQGYLLRKADLTFEAY
ncbi:hypothetical protein GH733_005614 [Mirounga leonina]|nr:hypothetical protein GH733_005614 [Mirounga leonina]